MCGYQPLPAVPDRRSTGGTQKLEGRGWRHDLSLPPFYRLFSTFIASAMPFLTYFICSSVHRCSGRLGNPPYPYSISIAAFVPAMAVFVNAQSPLDKTFCSSAASSYLPSCARFQTLTQLYLVSLEMESSVWRDGKTYSFGRTFAPPAMIPEPPDTAV